MQRARSNPTWAPLAAAALALFLGAACAGGNDAQVPTITFTNLSHRQVITTNNRKNRNLTIRGRIENLGPNDAAAVQVINNLGAFPSAVPGMSLSVGPDGEFSLLVPDPLANASLPFLAGSGGNAILIRAANEDSPLDQAGNPIPQTRSIRLFIDNQVQFTNPSYATIAMDGSVDTGCDLQTSNALSGTFSFPATADDASTVITAAEVVARSQASLFEDPFDGGFDDAAKPIAVMSDGTFTVDIDAAGWTPGYDPVAEIQADRNFFLRFSSESPAARALMGESGASVDLATFPFRNCLL